MANDGLVQVSSDLLRELFAVVQSVVDGFVVVVVIRGCSIGHTVWDRHRLKLVFLVYAALKGEACFLHLASDMTCFA